jgi:hypothetical protein
MVSDRSLAAPGLLLAASLLACAHAPAAQPPAAREAQARADEAREALRSQGYHWYDAKKDALKSIVPPAPPKAPFDSSSGPSGGSNWSFSFPDLGTALLYVLGAVVVAALIAGLIYGLRRFQAWNRAGGEPKKAEVAPARYESLDLADSLGPIDSDPYAHAKLLRDRGDRAGAIIWLFIHVVLVLDQRRMIRIVPGRTGRQIIRSVEDREARRRIEPTLRLFEAAFYGHREPDPESFDRAWGEAEAFLRSPAEKGAPR